MELEIFRNNTTPAAIKMSGLEDVKQIYDLAKEKNPESRSTLFKFVCSLLRDNLSDKESELVADVLIEIIEQAEKEFRVNLSEYLSTQTNVPLRLVLKLANDKIDVAAPILKHSSSLGEYDLLYIIKLKSEEYWCAIAERKILTDKVMASLVETGSLNTALALAKNNDVIISSHVMVALSDMVKDHETLSIPLMHRKELTSDLVTKIYNFVGDVVRQQIIKENPEYEHVLNDATHVVQNDLKDNIGKISDNSKVSMYETAKIYHEKGLLNISFMISTLRKGYLSSFIAQFAVFTDVSFNVAEDIIMQGTGQKLAVACRAFDIDKENFLTIFILSKNINTHGRLASADEMNKALQYFTKAEKELALKIMKGLNLQ